ncbi:MAG: UDP-3-O-(3-hydroxymyristoyl)glucosamine N-acyltransferase [Planctomycetota bacterium]
MAETSSLNSRRPAPPPTLGELAALVGAEVVGDPNTYISGAWPIDDATPGCVTLIDHADRVDRLAESPAAAAVGPTDLPECDKPMLLVADPHAAFAALVQRFRPRSTRVSPGVAPTSVIDPSTTLGDRVAVGSNSVIGRDCVIGDDVQIGPGVAVGDRCHIGAGSYLAAGVVLYDGVRVGSGCRIHSNAVLGADGFGYQQRDGRHELVAQLGSVELGDNVDVGAGACIDRGVYGPTRVGEGTKIDNLVQIGHNCRIGRHNLICSQVGIAGSTSTGDYVVMAGQVGVRDHVHIGEGAVLSAMAGVSNNVAAGETVLGAPATPLKQQKLQMAAVAKLPQLRKDFRKLRREVDELLEETAPQGSTPEAADDPARPSERAA